MSGTSRSRPVRPRPAVLLGPEGTGLSRRRAPPGRCSRRAGIRGAGLRPPRRALLGDPEEMLARCMPLLADPDRMRGIGHAALDVLRAEPRTDPDRIAAVGYGTGGAIGLELGRDGVDLRAIGTVNDSPRADRARRRAFAARCGPGSGRKTRSCRPRNGTRSPRRCRPRASTGASRSTAAPCTPSTTRPVRPHRAPRRRLPPTARAASLARRRRPARRVPARQRSDLVSPNSGCLEARFTSRGVVRAGPPASLIARISTARARPASGACRAGR